MKDKYWKLVEITQEEKTYKFFGISFTRTKENRKYEKRTNTKNKLYN